MIKLSEIIIKKFKLKNRFILSFIICILPLNCVRIALYQFFFGYIIKKSKIGWMTLICVDEASLHGCFIGRNNRFIGPMKITIQKDTQIGSGNTFICGWWTKDEHNRGGIYDRKLDIGEKVHITSGHHFDIAGSFTIGNNSWIAGLGSQFWTHGAGVSKRNVQIGKHCYIGSAVRFVPGSSIGDHNIVSIGSVVIGNIEVENALIGGMPAKTLVKEYDWEKRKNIWRQNYTGSKGK